MGSCPTRVEVLDELSLAPFPKRAGKAPGDGPIAAACLGRVKRALHEGAAPADERSDCFSSTAKAGTKGMT
ncbi:hypothetical protein CGMCC3_g6263 [Colletotrichum fructicola]|nr:uncharacterized protein CGMCC3_g6263 [Colletotrichum fructicola]KAE9577701.1 hypothetical protein CGMCC3_g6263 [Colletotrichum fructicola]